MINRQNTASFFRSKDEDSGRITISKQEYDQLVEAQKLLRALQNAGVDNWEGYDFALDVRNAPDIS